MCGPVDRGQAAPPSGSFTLQERESGGGGGGGGGG